MLPTLSVILFLSSLFHVEGSATFQDEYRGDYVPKFIDSGLGRQVVAPNTPYVAVSGRNSLYFIDTRHDAETAQHIKAQIEHAAMPHSGESLFIDEIAATAELRDAATGKTIFVFDPPYARVLFAKGINKRNPDLKLPEHEPAGSWEVSYDLGSALRPRAFFCYDFGCHSHGDCIQQTNGNCNLCHHYRVDNECDQGLTNAIGICTHGICRKAVDTPRETGESDAAYYQRMDKLHWH
ncbi:uncharacterized protein BBA_06579 [Beauveria bassiana ARSEF 2860]|uniref:Ankyrin repeat-containing protein n=1 Tax=Beauveria bassiana (strain ARSEF 2860) TaxID=655819 RepID=J4W286_BEAB2|nr:uncharacterized protein BBA_06579 [Beauveria bassiana ARSEF 2860]EJP64585.1 hypothetical protein BBA_06579 [Beauveria bassiana ARSEF 2860]